MNFVIIISRSNLQRLKVPSFRSNPMVVSITPEANMFE